MNFRLVSIWTRGCVGKTPGCIRVLMVGAMGVSAPEVHLSLSGRCRYVLMPLHDVKADDVSGEVVLTSQISRCEPLAELCAL